MVENNGKKGASVYKKNIAGEGQNVFSGEERGLLVNFD
jgi:hypothetical protein